MFLSVAIGGALGASLRYAVSIFLSKVKYAEIRSFIVLK
jgi:fluoride ion exporter CrcB/FEX